MQDALSKIFINLASGTLQIVLVLYLVLHQGASMQMHCCILQGDVRTKVKTPGTGKNMIGEAVQTSTMERLYKLHYIPVQGSCLVSNTQTWLAEQRSPLPATSLTGSLSESMKFMFVGLCSCHYVLASSWDTDGIKSTVPPALTCLVVLQGI
jgi:hypothetical protein